ncbi:ABC transporter ATPase [Opitutaceae bacterium TAV5]|nr:ABC transporter ATPase [Opitutaceae bacterium TAV5]
MKILTEGHRYELANFEKKDAPGQVIQFIEKVPESPGSATLVTVNDGTTNEELARVLINRIQHLNGKFPCRENAIAITHFETGLMWLEKRTADRVARNVEGKATT